MDDDDAQLVRRAQEGDASAFGQLMNRHHPKVYGQALRMMKSSEDAKDVAQQAWIKAWNKLGGFRGDSAFTSWIYRITTFAALDEIRKRQARRESYVEDDFLQTIAAEPTGELASPSQIGNLEKQELRNCFDQAVEALPPQQKEAILLREVEGLSYEEIARRADCKIGTVMSRLFNARKNIQKSLAAHLS